MTCRQYGAMQHQKEQSKRHPVYRIFSTRTNTIRKHHQRGKIPDELRERLFVWRSPIGTKLCWTATMPSTAMLWTWSRNISIQRRGSG